uniref:Polycystic kidney disease 2-like 1 protein n=1 Tax=Romanomermis culicivorax TaxID=13658 RepID=A0A915IHF6_ROMCU
IWQTKFTEDVSKDKELYIRTTLRELIIYILFLIDLCIVSFGMTSSSTFYFTNAMMSLFLDQSSPGVSTFRQSAQINDFCLFANGSMLDGLYWETWYNGENVTSGDLGYIYYANKLLGKPRLRMLRVKNSSCDVADAFTREIKECYGSYAPDIEDQSTFGPNGSFVYYTESQLNGTTFWGQLAAYSGGGYIQELAMTKGESLSITNNLIQNLWIGRGTRAVFLDFTVYNANINLFSVIKLLLEIPPTGGVIPTWSFRTVKLIRYVNFMDYIVLVCEGIFCAFIVYYIIEECIEIFKHRCSYFGSFWNCLDLLVIAISLCCIGFSIYRSLVVDAQLTQLLAEPDTYSNFEYLSFAQTRFNDVGAVLVFFAWIKIFKYISFNKTMTQLSSTLSRCSKDVGGFAIMFFIFFFAYAQLGYLLFGTQVLDYSTFYNATFTLLRIILGDFNFQALEQANRVLGPIYFITFVFFVFFILLNMFLAIINDTYGEVKSELASKKDEFQLYDYLKEIFYSNRQ